MQPHAHSQAGKRLVVHRVDLAVIHATRGDVREGEVDVTEQRERERERERERQERERERERETREREERADKREGNKHRETDIEACSVAC